MKMFFFPEGIEWEFRFYDFEVEKLEKKKYKVYGEIRKKEYGFNL